MEETRVIHFQEHWTTPHNPGYTTYFCMMLDNNDTVIGSVKGQIDDEYPDDGWVFDLFVAENYRRQGYATKLLELMEDVLREHQCTMSLIVCYQESDPWLHEFYKSKGYKETKIKDYYEKNL